ncbi:phosphoglycerate mutase [Histoplasma capsulatum G186AR]|uniref:Phosphoglycerate mutase n=1 Tax=Ajellomyces capsulatus (strain G186AR / H82 / ATCC MYA-2454 / RMSCC 2432) TaxID=447093 RepID=C0NWY6_AJECG|nr:phosphoglycerate mutase [Histoplasma capsulatum G186AR]EEH03852.1 phosphoglycerate mutase [Histoplasma capsulatum G186AR]
MGKPPAVIIIARHGARLDAVDKQWHLTSPTPYDPPLTYGGWNQARALGIRIRDLLRAREKAVGLGTNGGEESQLSRKQRIIIHTSPFLRCVQTAIGVSAGMRLSKHSPLDCSQSSQNKHRRLHSGSPASRGSDSNPLSAIPEPSISLALSKPTPESPSTPVPKYKLRLDAFLGEWLTPDYFEHISPPPGSVMMIACAKAELLRRGEPIEAGLEADGKSMFGHFPGGWINSFASGAAKHQEAESGNGSEKNSGAFKHVAPKTYELAHRNRSGSFDTGANGGMKPAGAGISKIAADIPAGYPGYVPPIPTYAISPSDPIPTGYVSHARDACIDIDSQWDSMRDPQNWGNGGEYGEEWSAMHQRFRNGLQHMIDWYRSEGPGTADPSNAISKEGDAMETVLILISHGAGCNALIGALTGQPVLLDVAMTSLTMAVRKPETAEHSGQETAIVATSKQDSPPKELADEYEMKFVSSTEHLRTTANSSHAPQASSPRGFPASSSAYHRRFVSTSGSTNPQENFTIEDSVTRKQGNSEATSPPYFRSSSASKSPSSGLWGAGSSISADRTESVDDLVPNFEDPKPISASRETASPRPQVSSRLLSQHGLWGSVSAPERELPMKRRWTMSERNI